MSTSAMAAADTTRVKWLVSASSGTWLQQALAYPDLLLIDHAHCERKAAGAALQLMFRYPSDIELAAVLSPLAQEELQHFDRVLALLERRGLTLKTLPAPPYGAALAREIRRQEPDRMLDSFLVAGLIEARSHERMALLASHAPDPELRELYGDLLASEAKHFGLYWILSERRFGRALTVARLEQLAEQETRILSGALECSHAFRFHSVGIERQAVCAVKPIA
ncbi:tRNA-(ms[2]io[6]A)-hydroxylase [Synechococcus sp. CS-603]|uniref:tRNA-(ms[2]io[6]A)-hydroxylase n=1 Tax=Synechococcus sp. CS-603 TaxID=2847981 RepID=UPI00223B7794|nr:tRNA-(ms[2]io[6]A)-hydroxylase [Synechococcus sp. CS-603]MCT0201175.1 tRNA-(ms[2]io[6]A)-hydroxylase [Synechococcus sp. CS-603]